MRSERVILVGLAVLGIIGAFWFALLSPKRAELAELSDKADSLRVPLATQEQALAAAETAKESYPRNYQQLVVLGKAAPADDDTASLMVQVSKLANKNGIDFRSLVLSSDGAAAPTPPTGAAETTVDSAASGEAASVAPAAPATEASAATLPIGATVGTAGLPVMPYDLSFRGDFFEIADFMAGLDSQVASRAGGPGVNGRLMTIDGFALTADPDEGFPHLAADLRVRTFVTPADQGLTAGGTPEGPPATVPAATVPVVAE